METKMIFIDVLMLLLIACTNKAKNNVSLERNQHWLVGTKDTTLVEKIGNSFVKYHLQGDSIYRLEWGNETISNISKDTFKVSGSGILGLISNDENTIILGQGCGTSCIYYVILPLDPKRKEKK